MNDSNSCPPSSGSEHKPDIEKEQLSILLADDHAILRQGLRQLLETRPDLNVVDEAENGEEAIVKAISLKPDVILMDINMPKVNGYEASQAILTAWSDANILVLTNQDDADVVSKFLDLNIRGFLLKDIKLDALVLALYTAHAQKKVPLSEELQAKLTEAKAKAEAKANTGLDILTEREQEVLKALSKGMSNQELAEALVVSPKTVHNHLYNIYSKLGVNSRSEAIVWAIEHGFHQI